MDSRQLPLLKRVDWVTSLFLILTPVATFALLPYYVASRTVTIELVIASLLFFSAASMSITGGYHRLMAHRAYDANRFVKAFFLLFGAATFQGSALKWCSDHRRHHRLCDTDGDPYSINRGFFFAHIGWLFLKDPEIHRPVFAPDLEADWMFRFQHRYYVPIAIIMCFGVPTLIGWALGSALGGFLFIGLLRLVVGHHCTFFINSACHMFGNRPYSEKITARDSFIMAVLTYGEGYHNFHHKFETDFRNGVRWYQWDPTKWTIQVLSWFKLTYRLNRVPAAQILKARLQTDEMRFLASGIPAEKLVVLRERIEEAQKKMRHLYEEYERLKAVLRTQSSEKLAHMKAEFKRIKAEIRIARVEFKAAFKAWHLQYQLSEALAMSRA